MYACMNVCLCGNYMLCTYRSLEKTISNLEMELAVPRMSSVGNGVTLQKPKSYSNHTLQKAFVVIGINTAFSSRKRRDSLRQTWMPTGLYFNSFNTFIYIWMDG